MSPIDVLPPEVRGYVRRFVNRRRRLALLKALGLAVAFALSWMLLWCMADRLIAFPGRLRLALLVIGAAAVTVLLARPLRGALRRRIDWIEAAGQIESRNTVFAQRLQTLTSQLLSRPEHRGSEEILDHLAQQVSEQAAAEMPRRLIPWRLVLRPWITAGLLTGLTAGLMQVPWLDLPTLMRRFARPLAAIAPVTTTRLIVQPGNIDIPQGQPLDLLVATERLGNSAVQLHLAGEGESWSHLAMAERGDDRFAYTLSSVDHDLRYYITGGDAASEMYFVRVLRKPGVAEFRIRYVYPSYTNHPPLVVSNTDGLIEAPVGTEATVSVTSTEPLSDAALIAGKDRLPMARTIDERVRQAKVVVSKDQTYQLELLSDRNVRGTGPASMTIHALPDRPPLARLLQPADDLRLNPREVLPVQYEALDDYGIGTLSLLTQINGATPQPKILPLGGDSRRQVGETAVDLATLEVKIGDVVSFSLQATDRANQKSTSEWRRVLISPRSIDLNAHLRIEELRQAEELAAALAGELDKSIQALSSPEFVASFKIDQIVAGASEDAARLRQRLLRVTIRSRSPAFSYCMASLVDSSQITSNLIDEIMQVLGGKRDGQRVRDRLTKGDDRSSAAPRSAQDSAHRRAGGGGSGGPEQPPGR